MNWLHDRVLEHGLWSPEGVADRIIGPALAAAPLVTVVDVSTVARWWFERTNPDFDWRMDVPTLRPSAEGVFIEAAAPRRCRRDDGGWFDSWPWPCRRWGVLLVAEDLLAFPTPEARRDEALSAMRTVESWEARPYRSTALLEEPRWAVAFYLIADQGGRAPALLGAGSFAVQEHGALSICVTPDPEQVNVAARGVAVPARPRTEATVAQAFEAFERLLAPLLFAGSLFFADNEPEPMVSVALAPPSRAEQLVPGPAPSRHLTLSLLGLPSVLAEAGADRPGGLASALRRSRGRFVLTPPGSEERTAA